MLFAIGEIINSPEQSMVIILEGIIHMGQNWKCLKGHILVDAQWHKGKIQII